MSSRFESTSIDRILAIMMGVIATVITSLGGLRLLENYARIEDFLLYRLSFNFSEGNGLVYNPGEKVLPTLSPLPAIMVGLLRSVLNQAQTVPQSYLIFLVTVIIAIGYGLAAIIFCYRLQQTGFSREEIVFITLAWLATFPVWASIRSPAPYTLALILLGLYFGEKGQWRVAGLVAGLSILVQPEGVLGCLALGLYALSQERGWRFWNLMWLPLAVWMIVAAFYYTDGYWSGLTLIGEPVTVGVTAQNVFWIVLFIVAAGIAYRVGIQRWLWVFFVWTALELIAYLLVFGELTQIHSLPLAVSVGIGLVSGVRQLNLSRSLAFGVIGGGILVFGLITVIGRPQTEDNLAKDMELSRTIGIPKDISILHDRSDGIIRHLDEFTGDIYHIEGLRSPFIRDFVERGDYESLIIATAPDVIYFNAENEHLGLLNLRGETLRALNYQKTIDVRVDAGQREGDEFWSRRADVGEFGDSQNVDLDFGPDVQLTGYAIDRARPQAGEIVRIRLDWNLDRPPTSSITVQLSLLDNTGNPVVSIFPIFDEDVWESLELSTYHALAIPNDVLPGRLRILVALDYKAAIIGENEIGTVVVAAPQPDQLPEAEGQIGDAILYESTVTPIDEGLRVDLVWGVEKPLGQDYQVLVHFTPLDNVQPLANGDGAPVNGRFPTSEWVVGEVVPDSHIIPLNDIAAGRYQVNVGFYILETFERLRDEVGDSLTIAQVEIDEDGTITVLPPE